MPLLALPPVWNNLMDVVDDPRIGLIILIGSMLLCTFLWLGRRPHVVAGCEQSEGRGLDAFLEAGELSVSQHFPDSTSSRVRFQPALPWFSEAVQPRHASHRCCTRRLGLEITSGNGKATLSRLRYVGW